MRPVNLFYKILLLIFLVGNFQSLYSQLVGDIESGLVSTGYNDVRIPGDQGTLFSLSKDLNAESKVFLRLRMSYSITERHTISALYAPLTLNSEGSFQENVIFAGVNFPSNRDIDATYKFNSYRLTYRYGIVRRDRFEFDLGFTAKVRDAKIALESQDLYGEKINVGFVPIINFRLLWEPDERLGVLFEGDALAAPQGRAEDVLLALTYRLSDRVSLKAGYRLLEGGAENAEVYTFSLFHYASAGLLLRLR